MSRKILSYADLGPITSVTTPIAGLTTPVPGPSSPHRRSPSRDKDSPSEPPRKRVRVNNEEDESLSYPTPSKDTNNGIVHANGNVSANANGGGRKGKKLQRPGNPSNVPWTRHWDSQVSYDGNGGEVMGGLAYEDEDAALVNTSTGRGSPRRGGPSVPHRDSNKRNGRGGVNGSSSKIMPPPTSQLSFIGPVIPPSPSTNVAPDRHPADASRDPEKKARGKNGNGRGAKTKPKEKAVVSLVNEEEWDDSALIDAWNAAEEEYREMNGGKKWRCEPVKHSSLWHDEFHEDTDEEPSDNDDDEYEYGDDGDAGLQESFGVIAETAVEESYEVDESNLSRTQASFSHALSGNMPLPHPHSHADPSAPVAGAPFPIGSLPVPFPVPVGTTRSSIMEEAFRRAQEASYTAGYWTAVYQMHASQNDPPPAQSPEKKLNSEIGREDDRGILKEEEEEGEIEEEEGDFVPAQR